MVDKLDGILNLLISNSFVDWASITKNLSDILLKENLEIE